MVEVAISIGVGLAVSALSSLLTPATQNDRNKLNDLSSPKSNYGVAIPKIWGKVKVAGNLVWATDKIERSAASGGGGKGGPRVSTTNYTYHGNFAMLFCRGQIQRFERIWLNSQLVYSTNDSTVSNEFAANYMRQYLGTSNQNVDPLLLLQKPTADDGLGIQDDSKRAAALTALGIDPNLYNYLSTAYRNRAYLVFENLPLVDYYNDFPIVSAEIVQSDYINLASILSDILIIECGYNSSDINVDALTNIQVYGFYLDSTTAAKDAIAQLESIYFVEHYQSNGVLTFVPENRQTTSIFIPSTDLAAYSETNQPEVLFSNTIKQSEELPSEIRLIFKDKNRSYNENTVYARRQTLKNINPLEFSTNIILDESKAQTVVDISLLKVWGERQEYEIALQPKYLALELGDRLIIEGLSKVQIVEKEIGSDLMLKLKLKQIDLTGFDFNRSITSGNINTVVATLIGSVPLPLCGDGSTPIKIESLIKNENQRLLVENVDYILNGDNTVTFLPNDQNDPISANESVFVYYQCPVKVAPKPISTTNETTNWVVLDLCNVDIDPKLDRYLYLFAGGTAGNKYWKGATINFSLDGNFYQYLDKIERFSTFGKIVNSNATCAGERPWSEAYLYGNSLIVDQFTFIDVQIVSGSLESATNEEIAAGYNKFYFYSNDILQFKDVELIGENLYRLTNITGNLYRGLSWERLNNFVYDFAFKKSDNGGLESQIDNYFSTDTQKIFARNNEDIDFVLLTGKTAYFKKIAYNNSDIGVEKHQGDNSQFPENFFYEIPHDIAKTKYLKVASINQTLDAVDAFPFTIKGNSLKPPAVKILQAERRTNGDVYISWEGVELDVNGFFGYIVIIDSGSYKTPIKTFNNNILVSFLEQQALFNLSIYSFLIPQFQYIIMPASRVFGTGMSRTLTIT